MIDSIGPYTIDRELGRGGMGVVYLGRDTRLDRAVAIKALPAHLADDPDRLARFEREARTLASLNHPNVAGIHGVEEHDGARYLVLEFVEGETLAQRLDRGPLPVDEAIEVCAQIAAGVEAAHEAGVVHRDLKPGNIIITPGGDAKVLDFGLAKATEAQSGSSVDQTHTPTMTTPASPHMPTAQGAILGTAPYMSPEQARGRPVDHRTDIWSFGVVLYECLTGASPFMGETATDSIGAILHKEVDLDRLPAATPPNVRRLIERCLARDKRQRLQAIGDARIELRADDRALDAPAPPGRRRFLLTAVSGALVITFAALIASVALRPAPPTLAPMRVSLEPPVDARILFSGDLAGPPVLSPDGLKVAFVAMRSGELRRLWVRDLRDPEPRELMGTDGALFPFWSPDSSEIGFFTTDSMRRFDLVSGTVQRISSADQGRGASWADDGRIVFSPNFRGGLSMVNARGGEATPITAIDDERHTSHRWPFVIPGTDRFLYSAVTSRVGEADNNAIYLASLSGDAEPVRLMASDFSAAFAAGHLLYVRGGVLLASRLDLQTGRVGDDQVVVARDVAADLSTWHGQFSASTTGAIVFNQRAKSSGAADAREGYSWSAEGDRVTAFDASGREITAYAADTPMLSIALSRDGRTLAMAVISGDRFTDLWSHPTAFRTNVDEVDPELVRAAVTAPEPRRLTYHDGAEVSPVWSPDGTEVAFRWDGDGVRPRGIYRKRIGGGAETLIRDNEGRDDHPADWTTDGKYIVVVSDTLIMSDRNDIYAIPLDGGDPIPLVTDPGPDYWPAVSPDGRWLAYTSRAGGRNQVYVIPFAPAWPDGAAGRKWLVSENAGRMPKWSHDGEQLYYISDAANLIELDVDTAGDTFVFSTPRALFQTPYDTGRNYAVTPKIDGLSQFLFMDSDEQPDAPAALLLNWPSLLR